MAQAMRAMQVTTATTGALAGSSLNIDASRRAPNAAKRAVTALPLRASMKEESVAPAAAAAAAASVVALANAGAANALTAENVTGAYVQVQSVASQVGEAAGTVFGVAKDVVEQVVTRVKPAVDVLAPYAQQSTDYAIKSVVPFATDLEQQAEKALQSNGLDTKPVVDAAKTAVSVAGEAAGQAEKYIEGAQPSISSTVENVLSSDPLVLATGAGALLLLYFLAPPLLSSVSYAFRGFKGELTALKALDLLSKEDYVLLDVRSEKEKSKSGVPSLPRNAKNKLLPIPVEEVPGKQRGQLRNIRKLEAEITALKIAALKRINKGSRIIIIDSNGDVAKVIARSLSASGFSNAWVITDGFTGGRGWVQSKLGTESSRSSFSEILSPSRIIPSGTTFLPAARN